MDISHKSNNRKKVEKYKITKFDSQAGRTSYIIKNNVRANIYR